VAENQRLTELAELRARVNQLEGALRLFLDAASRDGNDAMLRTAELHARALLKNVKNRPLTPP
jgi:hypothetical protein